LTGLQGIQGVNGLDGLDGINPILNYDSLSNIVSANSSFISSVSNGMNYDSLTNLLSSNSSFITNVSSGVNYDSIANLISSSPTFISNFSNEVNYDSLANLLSSNSIFVTNITNGINYDSLANILSSNSTFISNFSNDVNYDSLANLLSSNSTFITNVSSGINYDSLVSSIALDSTFISSVSNVIEGPSYIESSIPYTTALTTDGVVMGSSSLSPGTYLVSLNTVYEMTANPSVGSITTSSLGDDLDLICNDLNSLPVTNSTHAITFGLGEILTPGVYDIAGAISISGSLILDGGGDPNAVFVIKASAALGIVAAANIELINGAKSSNVYWMATGAITVGAGTTISGTMISTAAAVHIYANCIVSGRALTKLGAMSVSSSTCELPTDPSFIDMRTLSTFFMFTKSGAIANALASTIVGDIATNLGLITGFETANLTGTIFLPGVTNISTPSTSLATFSIYSDNVIIPGSVRERADLELSRDVYLQAIVTITAGQIIDVRVKIDNGTVTLNNRILSFVKLQ
jgi:hypothetical protein